jgi:hypothetical protein
MPVVNQMKGPLVQAGVTMSRATLFLLLALLACSSNSPAKVGESCKISGDCATGLSCYLETTPGVCSVACSSALACPTDSACAPLVTTVGDQLCLGSCSSNAGCGAGYTCCAALGNVCTPAARCSGTVTETTGNDLTCAPRTLINGGVVGPATQPTGCQKPVVNASFAGAQVQVLGPLPVTRTPINFNVPPGTGTISILQQVVDGGTPDTLTIRGQAFPNAAVPFQLLGPDGGVFYDDDVQPANDLSTMEVALAQEAATATMILPNTTQALAHEDGGYPAGAWSMIVNDIAFECALGDSTTAGCVGGTKGQQYDIQIVTKPVAGATGTIDLGLYLVSDSWTAASAIADSTGVWTRALDTIKGIYARGGICLGKVTFYDVPAWAKAVYATGVNAGDGSPCGLLDQMFTLSQPGGAIPIFFVDDIQAATSTTNKNGGTIVGIDGAIPGPAGAGGTVHSGALVNVSNISSKNATCNGAAPAYSSCGPDVVGYIIAHEAGHYLGLFHTSESDGTLFDPIGDTPQCAPSCNKNATTDSILSGSECNDDSSTTASCGGASNTMFWLISPQAQALISPQQARILRANPAVY